MRYFIKISYKKVSIYRSPYSHKKFSKKTILKKELDINANGDIPNHDNVISFDESFMSIESLTKEYEWSKIYRPCLEWKT